jgi:hypothetical protein
MYTYCQRWPNLETQAATNCDTLNKNILYYISRPQAHFTQYIFVMDTENADVLFHTLWYNINEPV